MAQLVKNPPAIKETACNTGEAGLIPGLGTFPGEGNGQHSSILAWEIPWTEKKQVMGSQDSDTI